MTSATTPNAALATSATTVMSDGDIRVRSFE
jgi:hypothetical protein